VSSDENEANVNIRYRNYQPRYYKRGSH
jgi:hypothetical protein